MKRPAPRGQELFDYAERLGVSMGGLPHPSIGPSGPTWAYNEPEVQRRVMEMERHIRDGRLWWVAVISAVASALSAAAAWLAVLMHRTPQ